MDAAGPGSSERIAVSAVAGESSTAAAIDEQLDNKTTLKALVLYCLFHLGHRATNEDAEDALQDFCEKQRLKVIQTYKSGAQSPVEYFKLCLKRFCWKRGRQLRRRRAHQALLKNGLQVIHGHEESSPTDRVLTEARQRQHEQRELRLLEAIARLSPAEQNLLTLHYDKGLSMREIATQLGISESATKVRLFRIRNRLNALLEIES